MKERVQQMLNSGQPEAINKRIVKTGGVRVLGRAAPKPQIHVVQNVTVTQQHKTLVTSNSNDNLDSTQVSEKPSQDIINNEHKENDEELHKDSAGKEADKEDSEVQKITQPKREPRRKRRHMLSSEVKPVSKQPSASALSMASQPPSEKPIPVPRAASTPKKTEEDMDNDDTTTVPDVHDEVCTTPPLSSGAQSPDSIQVSLIKRLCM